MTLGYIGPGGGFALMGAFFALVIALISGLFSLAVWPIRVTWRTIRSWSALRRAKVRRIVYLGLDGLDPKLTERFMEEGKLPNLARLRDDGGYRRLATTFPCLSPVAWSCFATGVNPARHNIFDFLRRNSRTYHPELSSARVRPPERYLELGPFKIPLERARVDSFRKSVPFWKLLGDQRVTSTILRVPVTFPPEKFSGHMLSAMCTPDLRGTQGSFTYFSTAVTEPSYTEGARMPLVAHGDGWRGTLEGPPGEDDNGALTVDFELVRTGRNGREAFELRLDGVRTPLVPQEYSDWLTVSFRAGVGRIARGIVRARITQTEPELGLYFTPIQIDPARPALPISQPSYYAAYLSKLMGRYATLGLAEDTWAMNEGVLDEDGFLEQAWLHHGERETMFFNALDKTRRGVVACVFDASDRIQHMFFRCFDQAHPANRDREVDAYASVVEDTYKRLDDLVGRARKRADDGHTLFVVLSDHGFANFRRGVHLNQWLRENGYLALEDGAQTSGRFFDAVDWERTRAYAVGLGGIYLNIAGRESHGTVEPQEAAALCAEIAAGLRGLRDGDEVAIGTVEVTRELYRGPYMESAPDILVGYSDGYRASWGTAVGEVADTVFEDNDRAWGGDHCIDPALVPGVLFANRTIDLEDPSLLDFAPTTLAAFGLDVPRHMEGRLLFADFGAQA